jgi:5,10-methylenetetrahydromethanopterin reductase
MQIGVCVASHIRDIETVIEAERLGFSHAWMADSQMLWSDCYATLALAAHQTSHIQLGTGVAVSATRPAPVHAAAIATINALAPGRTFFGIGTGNTAMRTMGQPPHRIREFDRYLESIQALLRGEEAMMDPLTRGAKEAKPIRHIMPEDGFVNFADPIPLYVSGFGPRSLGLAGKYGDGAVLSLPANPDILEFLWRMIEAGATDAGRKLDRNEFYTTALTTITVLEPGESADSDRVKNECGAMAMATVHYAYEQFCNFGHPPPALLEEMWPAYTKLLEEFPAERRHQRIHAGHNCWVIPEEECFLTEELLRATCMIGTRDELLQRLRDLEAAGLNQVMVLPGFDARRDVLATIASELLPELSPRA